MISTRMEYSCIQARRSVLGRTLNKGLIQRTRDLEVPGWKLISTTYVKLLIDRLVNCCVQNFEHIDVIQG